MAPDETVSILLDNLIASGHVVVPRGEIRTGVVNAARRYGKFGLQAQLGRFGCRFQARETPLGPLRLRRLGGKLYDLDNETDVSELEWHLEA
jgi:hypothetical protein